LRGSYLKRIEKPIYHFPTDVTMSMGLVLSSIRYSCGWWLYHHHAGSSPYKKAWNSKPQKVPEPRTPFSLEREVASFSFLFFYVASCLVTVTVFCGYNYNGYKGWLDMKSGHRNIIRINWSTKKLVILLCPLLFHTSHA
jgi:hypothetical protein